jgi:hypothetical protein
MRMKPQLVHREALVDLSGIVVIGLGTALAGRVAVEIARRLRDR